MTGSVVNLMARLDSETLSPSYKLKRLVNYKFVKYNRLTEGTPDGEQLGYWMWNNLTLAMFKNKTFPLIKVTS